MLIQQLPPRPPSRPAPWLVDGLITTLLGGLLIAHWPSDSVWAPGALFACGLAISAVNLLTYPVTRIASTGTTSTAA